MISQELIGVIKQGFKLDWRGVHGVPHWARVRENGLRIGKAVGANLAVVELFAFLHDSKRFNDDSDPEHGHRAAEFARSLRGSLIKLSDQDFELLTQACLRHSDGLTEADITVQTCWDADRLDLGRVGIKPAAAYLCTPVAKDPALIRWAYSRSLGRRTPSSLNEERDDRAIYLTNPNLQPDADFEAGELRHLVVGNNGRLMDARRTPVRITDIKPETGTFVIEILDFEDQGARWEESFENTRYFQFERGSRSAHTADIARFQAAVAQFNRTFSIACDPTRKKATIDRLIAVRRIVGAWLSGNSRFFAKGGQLPPFESRVGEPLLYEDLRGFMDSLGLWEIEETFARQFVSYPHSGDLIKGHRIVLAEMGLIPYEGKVVRNPALFDGEWSKERRAQHILSRLAFVHEIFARLGLTRLVFYRAISHRDRLLPHPNHSFVSATFSRAVAEANFDGYPQGTSVLYRQNIPVQRVFMTYLETVQMNRQLREAEAILLYEKGNLAF